MQLTSNMRVRGLKRKDKIGTVFSINREPRDIERAKGINPPVGYATLKSRSKDGTVTATLQATGEDFTFQATDTTIWPKTGT